MKSKQNRFLNSWIASKNVNKSPKHFMNFWGWKKFVKIKKCKQNGLLKLSITEELNFAIFFFLNLRLSNILHFDIRLLIFHIFIGFFAFLVNCLPMNLQKSRQIRNKFALATLELKMGFMDFHQMFNQVGVRREFCFAIDTLFVSFLRVKRSHLDNLEREILEKFTVFFTF